jgi:hypothetical protein
MVFSWLLHQNMCCVFGCEWAVIFGCWLAALPALEIRDHVTVIIVVVVSACEFFFVPTVLTFERCGEVAAVLTEDGFDFHCSSCFRKFSRCATIRARKSDGFFMAI